MASKSFKIISRFLLAFLANWSYLAFWFIEHVGPTVNST